MDRIAIETKMIVVVMIMTMMETRIEGIIMKCTGRRG
jgi:hypothetical protein